MHVRSVSYWVLASLLPGTATLIAQTPDIQQQVDHDLTVKRLQGAWTPELLVTTNGAEAYPLSGRAVSFEGSSFTRIEGKHIVASGSFKVEYDYLSLTVKDAARGIWRLRPVKTQ